MNERLLESGVGEVPVVVEGSNGFRLRTDALSITTREQVELINITDRVAEKVRASGVNKQRYRLPIAQFG